MSDRTAHNVFRRTAYVEHYENVSILMVRGEEVSPLTHIIKVIRNEENQSVDVLTLGMTVQPPFRKQKSSMRSVYGSSNVKGTYTTGYSGGMCKNETVDPPAGWKETKVPTTDNRSKGAEE